MEKTPVIKCLFALIRNPLVFIAVLLSISTSCTQKQAIQYTYLKGVLAWNQQDWNTAVIHFTSAEQQAKKLSGNDTPSAEQYSHYAAFALASSYLVQNEDKAATQKIIVQPSEVPSFMQVELEDPSYPVQEGFGATVSLSRKRRGKK